MSFDPQISREQMARLSARVYAEAGLNLPESKHMLVHSRLAKRTRALGLESPEDYCQAALSRGNEEEFGHLLDALTTNKTSLFREARHLEHLASVIPTLARPGGVLRLWSAACSSGEEAYSMAICALEALPGGAPFKVLGTDLSRRMIRKAVEPQWTDEQALELPEALRRRYLASEEKDGERHWRPVDALLQACLFAEFNLNGPAWPFHSRFDVIFCRNVMIYFDRPVQQALLKRLCAQLAVGGYLYTGLSENLLGLEHSLKSVGPSTYCKTADRP
jgi:chemotaxis protein methyltransferase CheR